VYLLRFFDDISLILLVKPNSAGWQI